jgi:hypothetical protein
MFPTSSFGSVFSFGSGLQGVREAIQTVQNLNEGHKDEKDYRAAVILAGNSQPKNVKVVEGPDYYAHKVHSAALKQAQHECREFCYLA